MVRVCLSLRGVMKVNQTIILALLILAGLPGGLLGQAMAEHAAASGAAPTVAAPMKSVGKGISSALNNAGKALDKTQAVSSRSRPARGSAVHCRLRSSLPAQRASVESPKVLVSYEDPNGIQVGVAYEELLRRFGQPSMMITGEDGQQKMYYTGNGHTAEVLVRDGVVVSVKEGNS